MQHERNTKEIDRIGSIGILINNKTKTEMISFANGGPHSPAMRIAVKPVDYKGGELSNLSSGLFLKYKSGGTSSRHETPLFFLKF